MREIKFRAWDGNQMHDSPYFFEANFHSDSPRPYRFYEDWIALEDGRNNPCEIMQFTGLKDKNGKEIYEGDIVKDLGYFERLTEEQAMDSGIAMIKYHQCGFIAHYKGIELFSVEYIDFDDRFEIIGNIYENPELIKI